MQLRQLFFYWFIGILFGSFISVFAKDKIHNIMSQTNEKKWGLLGIFPAIFSSLSGIIVNILV